ncbi:MAG: GNAT family N-acetyltransferase [bacterium]
MLIRKAEVSDIQSMVSIEKGSPGYPAWGENGLSAELRNPLAFVLTAEENGTVIGFAGARFLPPQAELNTIVTRAEHAGKGVARAFLDRIFEEAAVKGCSCVTLEVDEANAAAMALYVKKGFKIVGRRPKFYNGERDAVLMTAELKSEKVRPQRKAFGAGGSP